MHKRRITLGEDRALLAVQEIIGQWNDYQDFAGLFNSLMGCNQLTNRDLERQLASALGRKSYSYVSLGGYRNGAQQPPYRFIEDLLSAQPNPLHLDTQAHRIPLFTKAGLVEVTPETIAVFNCDVLMRAQQRLEKNEVTWSQVVHKLLDFHMQGGRRSFPDIAGELAHQAPESQLPAPLLTNIVNGRSNAAPAQRQAIYSYLGLDKQQAVMLDGYYGRERLMTACVAPKDEGRRSPFNAKLDEILTKLSAQKISSVQIAERSRDPASGVLRIHRPYLTQWRNTITPTLFNMRVLIEVLNAYAKEGIACTEMDVQELVELSPYTQQQLNNTSHDVIANIRRGTPIKDVLKAIRNASDIGMSVDDIFRIDIPSAQPAVRITANDVERWENKEAATPNETQVRELLRRYNFVLALKGNPTLHDSQIDRVASWNLDNTLEQWEGKTPEQRHAAMKPRNWRELIKPDVEPRTGGRWK